MAKARRPARKPRAKPVPGEKRAPVKAGAVIGKTPPTTAVPAKAQADTERGSDPYDPEHERPMSELPPLTFPNSGEYEFRLDADRSRRSRIRNEVIFAVVLAVAGLIAFAAGHTPAVLGLAVIAVVAMAAYELIISGLE